MGKFSEIVKRLMVERGVSASVVCRATGIPKSTLSEWLTGREPKFNEAIVRLARFFGVSAEYLIMEREPEEEIVKDVFGDVESGFVTVHRGVYRLRLEKYTGSPKKKG